MRTHAKKSIREWVSTSGSGISAASSGAASSDSATATMSAAAAPGGSAQDRVETGMISPYDSDDEDRPSATASSHANRAGGAAAAGDTRGAGGSAGHGREWRQADVEADWEGYVDWTARTLRSSSTKARKRALDGISRILESGTPPIDSAKRVDLLGAVLSTYARLVDRRSRLDAQDVAMRIVSEDERATTSKSPTSAGQGAALKHVVGFLHKEAERGCSSRGAAVEGAGAGGGGPSLAASIRVGLFTWVCATYATLVAAAPAAAEAAKSPCFPPLLRAMAVVLDSVLGDASVKPAARHSCVVAARKTMRKAHPSIPAAIEVLCATPPGPAALHSIALLGLVTDVALRLRVRAAIKGGDEQAGQGYLREAKPKILAFLVEKLVGSKVAVPTHARDALRDWIAAELGEDDVASSVRPALEKMLLRSPEIALPIGACVFGAFGGDTAPHIKPLFASVSSASRSANAATRQGAVALWKTLVTRARDADVVAASAKEVVAALGGGKTTSPDQRAALFGMLAEVPGGPGVSSTIVDAVAVALPKENHEAAMQAAMAAVSRHLRWCLDGGMAPSVGVAAALAKEMQNAKVPLRKAVCLGVGELVMALPLQSETARDFCEALLPGWDANLKAASTNPLTSAAGPLEGYIAVAVLEGKLGAAQLPKAMELPRKNDVAKSLVSVSPKPSFLLNDKLLRKATSAEEQSWLVRALEAVLLSRSDAFARDAAARTSVAQAFAALAVSSSKAETRKEAVEALERLHRKQPTLVGSLVLQAFGLAMENARQLQNAAMTAAASAAAAAAASPAAGTKGAAGGASEGNAAESPKQRDISRDLRSLLSAAACFEEGGEEGQRMDAMVAVLVPSHRAELRDAARQCFIEALHRAGLEPRRFAEARWQQLLDAARASIRGDDAADRVAALAAISTLVLVAGDLVLPSLVAQVREEARTDEEVGSLEAEDLAIWKTPEGVLHVDVLSKKQDKAVDRNRKDAAIEAWEAELRESIARKKAEAARTLTKEQKAAVDAQLKLESQTRARVRGLERRLQDSFEIVQSMFAARSDALENHVATLLDVVVSALRVPQTTLLAGEHAQRAYASLFASAEERASDVTPLLRNALLRSVNESLAPTELRADPMRELALRVLYRLRFLSEQEPLRLATLSLALPFVEAVVRQGGLGLHGGAAVRSGGSKGDDDDEDDEDSADAAVEQVQLCLEVMRFHVVAAADPRLPRSTFIELLVHIISKHTQLAADAVSTLRDLGESMRATASADEIALLLRHTLADEVAVRSGCLQALQPLDLTHYDFCLELWLACHDADEENARLAVACWEDNGLDVPAETYASEVLPMLEHAHASVREHASRSLRAAAEMHPESASALIAGLRRLYDERAVELKPEVDQFGMVIPETVGREDPWPCRAAIAATLDRLAGLVPQADVPELFGFFISHGALGDRAEAVRHAMLDAGTALIDKQGAASLPELIGMFETYLASPSAAEGANDDVTHAVVILFGRVARHLEAKDERVGQVVERLVEALKTPSELVQAAVADCLAPLVRSLPLARFEELVERLFADLFEGATYAVRRGAAYGLSGGLIKGRGLATIADFGIMDRLAGVIADKKSSPEARQGAVMAYETMSATLQRLFEPYVPGILPHLLACFGDGATTVREATQEAARVIMQHMSGHCVRLVLPSLLEGLEEKQWRAKRGAIELLAAMAYCAPRQLSVSLPTIIPRLSEPLKDSHAQVRGAAERALKGFEAVIENPEVKRLVPTLLRALVDPNTKTSAAQRALLRTTYVHLVDAPSLALIVPVVDRGLRERSAAVQRDSARIVGNLAGITEARDFIPYLATLVPLVRAVLVSPVPEARAVAAKALGTLVERLGEVHLDYIVPELLAMLRSEKHTSVDRQGAAQGLAEVLAGLPIVRLEGLLPDIITSTKSARATVREGFLALLIYLPATYGSRFEVYLPRIVDPILSGISAEENSVREVSMRAGRMLIANYHRQAVELLLPSLEGGLLGDARWRIRLSSVQLVAELLFRLAGISGKATVDEDEGGAADENIQAGASIQRSLIQALGQERRDSILASLYILRQDGVLNVRQAATDVWKALVWNTPRVAKEILGVILDMVIGLTQQGEEQREMASRTLGEIVSKLGRLDQVIPLLRLKGASSDDAQLRAGVCLCIPEILANATKNQLEDHEDALIAIVRAGLIDTDAEVRHAAARAFDATQAHLGARAIDETIPTLLGALQDGRDGAGADSGSSETALAALREIMRARADVVFPVLVPTLTAQPIGAFNARAISALVRVAGAALNPHVSKVLGALYESLETTPTTTKTPPPPGQGEDGDDADGTREALQDAVTAMLASVGDAEGLHQLMLLLLGWAGSAESPRRRVAGCRFFGDFVAHRRANVDASDYTIDWLRRLVSLLDDGEAEVVEAAWQALDALVKSVPKNDLETLVVPLRRSVEATGSPGVELAGFCRPKGVSPLVPVFLAGLMNGTAEQREQGALGLADVVERTSAEAVRPFVTSMVGPLIRAAGDRHVPPVKAAILVSLRTMLRRIAAHCRPFYPQLQRSFVRALSDAALTVRTRGAEALGELMALQARCDPVILELVDASRVGVDGSGGGSSSSGGAGTTGSATGASAAGGAPVDALGVAESHALALSLVLASAPSKNVGASARSAVSELLSDAFAAGVGGGGGGGGGVRESMKQHLASCAGALAKLDDESAVGLLLERQVASPMGTDEALASLCLASVLAFAPELAYRACGGVDVRPAKVARRVGDWAAEGVPAVARPARESRELMRKSEPWCSDEAVLEVL